MPPPPAEPFASRVFLGPALRTQPDRRLVKLVREGYEAAFEEIVRRYRKPLDRFAAAFVGGRSEDVTQDAFSKALLALRGSEKEIELRPWLYRIVRNTALNELRDRPPAAAELNEVALPGGLSAAAEAERREEMAELMERLRALPEPQRAAIVMRELEGLSHEEIAAALGVSGGAARQTIYRARMALRDGLGMLVPLPLLRLLFDHGAEAAGASGAAAAAGAGAVAAGSGAAPSAALAPLARSRSGVATAGPAGSVGAGVAIQQERGGERGPAAAEAAVVAPARGGSEATALGPSPSGSGPSGPLGPDDERGRGEGGRGENRGESGRDDDRGREGYQRGEDRGHGDSSGQGRGRGRDRSGDDAEESHSGEDRSGSSGSGRHGSDSNSGSGGSGSGSGRSDSGHGGGSDDGGGGEDHSGSGSGGHGSSGDDDPAPVAAAPPPPEPAPEAADDDSSGSGSGSGDSGDGDGSGDDD